MSQDPVPAKHARFEYSAIVDRAPLRWPNGARVAIWIVPNVEHFLFDRPSTSITPLTMGLTPDVLNYSWRDYGVRVGIWRIMDIMQRHGFVGTAALNADVCNEYPRIIEAGNELGWEWMGHGNNNSTLVGRQDEIEERAILTSALDTIGRSVGRRPRGWLSPALSESARTLDILADCGIEYVGNWVNDEQPYWMRVKSGTMLSVPYTIELNDIPAFLDLKQDGTTFGRMICDQFDVLYEDGAQTGRVMAIAVHPFILGQPHRSIGFASALAHIASRQEVWITTGSQISDWFRRANPSEES
jgi:peptidoglycan/xylan/chitin deacetylase (PgdA/CDA1 family)